MENDNAVRTTEKLVQGKMKIFGSGNRIRCAWEVQCGVVPGQSMAEHTRLFIVTSDSFYADEELAKDYAAFKEKYPDGKGTFLQAQDEAQRYYISLQLPRYANWAQITWIWY